MSAYQFQFATLLGCVVLVAQVVIALKMRVITWQLSGLLLTTAGMYLLFYVWLLWFAEPVGNYTWISAALRTAEIFGAIGALSLIIYRSHARKSKK